MAPDEAIERLTIDTSRIQRAALKPVNNTPIDHTGRDRSTDLHGLRMMHDRHYAGFQMNACMERNGEKR